MLLLSWKPPHAGFKTSPYAFTSNKVTTVSSIGRRQQWLLIHNRWLNLYVCTNTRWDTGSSKTGLKPFKRRQVLGKSQNSSQMKTIKNQSCASERASNICWCRMGCSVGSLQCYCISEFSLLNFQTLISCCFASVSIDQSNHCIHMVYSVEAFTTNRVTELHFMKLKLYLMSFNLFC